MKRRNHRTLKELTYYSTVGLQVALSIFIGLYIGLYLDRRFDMAPIWMFVFLLFGILAGFRNIGLALRKVRNADRKG